jgi:protocatechuate 3,4-dioxygenase beta subunit
MTSQHHDDHDHDLGLQHDLKMIARRLTEQHLQERRRTLGWLVSGGAAAALVACGGGGSDASDSSSSSSSSTSSSSSSSSTSSTSSTTTSCVADPTETNGPFPSDGSNTVNGSVSNILTQSGIVRSDIRSSFGSSTTTAAGVELVLTINLVNADNSCAVLSDYAIYIWHCNQSGEYSLYASDIQDENYLRGVQVTDNNGQVTFTTILPACYSGRYPHIHIEVYQTLAAATSYANAVLTSQMAMPSDICTTVFDNATGYSASVANFEAVTTSTDSVFASSTAAQIAAQTPSLSGSVSDGYTGTITVALDV